MKRAIFFLISYALLIVGALHQIAGRTEIASTFCVGSIVLSAICHAWEDLAQEESHDD